MAISEEFTIGIDIHEGDLAVATVIAKNLYGSYVINVLQGKDACDIYEKLTGKTLENRGVQEDEC